MMDEEIDKLQQIIDMLQMQLVTQMRMYDALLALVRAANPEASGNLLMQHGDWKYIGPLPFVEQ